jgi:small subunit ribosomal protein S14
MLVTSYLQEKNDENFKIVNFLRKRLREVGYTKIKDRCIITGRSRGLIKDFRISRMKFKEFALKGLLPNISKLS